MAPDRFAKDDQLQGLLEAYEHECRPRPDSDFIRAMAHLDTIVRPILATVVQEWSGPVLTFKLAPAAPNVVAPLSLWGFLPRLHRAPPISELTFIVLGKEAAARQLITGAQGVHPPAVPRTTPLDTLAGVWVLERIREFARDILDANPPG